MHQIKWSFIPSVVIEDVCRHVALHIFFDQLSVPVAGGFTKDFDLAVKYLTLDSSFTINKEGQIPHQAAGITSSIVGVWI